MAGAPGLEQVKRLSAAHLADRDAVRAQSQRRADEIGQRGDTILCAQCHQVGSGAPKLLPILDEDDAIGRLGHLGKERIHQPRCAAGDEHILAAGNRSSEDLCGFGPHDP